MTLTERLKPCPFCGEQPISANKYGDVRCNNHECAMAYAEECEPKRWNTRHAPEIDRQGEWQDISTAPKPGVYNFLVGRTEDAGVPAVAEVTRIDKSTYLCLNGMTAFKNPTHWQPLPAPPIKQKEELCR